MNIYDGTAVYGPDNGGGELSIYRYVLTRVWLDEPGTALRREQLGQSGGLLMSIGLNSSTATAEKNDPTIAKMVTYAKAWGFAGLAMLNLFAFRSPHPKVMKAALDPVGPDNDSYLLAWANMARRIVCCWGVDGAFRSRGYAVRKLLTMFDLYSIGEKLCANGEPPHPLYLKGDLQPKLYRSSGVVRSLP
ncbi:MAG: DUF1643 domain-containing protein [Pseudomonadales bacterium]|nr:DUF1643 domain-containing protein [Pseudomonadales bacterium]